MCRPGADPAYVKRLRGFYRTLSASDLPFAVPLVLEVGNVGGELYAIEARLHGSSLTQYLLTATGTARTEALKSYLAAAEHIQTVPVDVDEFGELLASEPLRQRTWPAFLQTRAHQTLRQSQARLSVDVPALAKVVNSWESDLRRLGDVTTPKLVHGDYFPGNVIVDDGGSVTAVIDFSPMTVAGDPRLDPICALIFLEVDEGYQANDSRVLRQLIADGPHSGLLELENVYRTYYSLYFSNVPISHAELSGREVGRVADQGRWYELGLYRWCVANLMRARRSHPGPNRVTPK